MTCAVIVIWRDAKSDPPEDTHLHTTDRPVQGYYDSVMGWWRYEDHVKMYPQPKWWCEPSPPGDKAPTVEDIDMLLNVFDMAWESETIPLTRKDEATAARIRAMFDAIGEK